MIGTPTTTATPHFGTDHPLFRAIAELARARSATPALRRGQQIVRARSTIPGVFAVSRIDPDDGHEVLVAFNTATTPITAQIEVNVQTTRLAPLIGTCPLAANAPGSVRITLPALGYVVCEARR